MKVTCNCGKICDSIREYNIHVVEEHPSDECE